MNLLTSSMAREKPRPGQGRIPMREAARLGGFRSIYEPPPATDPKAAKDMQTLKDKIKVLEEERIVLEDRLLQQDKFIEGGEAYEQRVEEWRQNALAELQQAQSDKAEADDLNAQLAAALETATTEKTELELVAAASGNELGNVQAQQAHAQQQIKHLEDTVSKLRADLQSAESKGIESELTARDATTNMNAAKSNAAKLHAKLKEVGDEKELAITQLKQSAEDAQLAADEALEEQKRKRTITVQAAEKLQRKLQLDAGKLQEKFQLAAESAQQELQQQLQCKDQEIASLKAQLSEAQDLASSRADELGTHSTSHSEEIARLQAKAAALERQNTTQAGALAQQEKDKEEAERKSKEATQHVFSLNDMVVSVQKDSAVAAQQALEREAAGLAQLEAWQAKVESLEQANESAKTELQNTQSGLKELSANYEELQRKSEAEAAQARESAQKASLLEQELQAERAKLEESHIKYSDLKADSGMQRSERANLTRENELLKDRLKDMEAQRSERSNLSRDNEALRQSLQEMEAQLAAAKSPPRTPKPPRRPRRSSEGAAAVSPPQEPPSASQAEQAEQHTPSSSLFRRMTLGWFGASGQTPTSQLAHASQPDAAPAPLPVKTGKRKKATEATGAQEAEGTSGAKKPQRKRSRLGDPQLASVGPPRASAPAVSQPKQGASTGIEDVPALPAPPTTTPSHEQPDTSQGKDHAARQGGRPSTTPTNETLIEHTPPAPNTVTTPIGPKQPKQPTPREGAGPTLVLSTARPQLSPPKQTPAQQPVIEIARPHPTTVVSQHNESAGPEAGAVQQAPGGTSPASDDGETVKRPSGHSVSKPHRASKRKDVSTGTRPKRMLKITAPIPEEEQEAPSQNLEAAPSSSPPSPSPSPDKSPAVSGRHPASAPSQAKGPRGGGRPKTAEPAGPAPQRPSTASRMRPSKSTQSTPVPPKPEASISVGRRKTIGVRSGVKKPRAAAKTPAAKKPRHPAAGTPKTAPSRKSKQRLLAAEPMPPEPETSTGTIGGRVRHRHASEEVRKSPTPQS